VTRVPASSATAVTERAPIPSFLLHPAVDLASIVMRRFLVFASEIACDCAGVRRAGEQRDFLGRRVVGVRAQHAWSVISGPYFWDLLVDRECRWKPST